MELPRCFVGRLGEKRIAACTGANRRNDGHIPCVGEDDGVGAGVQYGRRVAGEYDDQ